MAVAATRALTAEQEAAVARRHGPLLLAAGAGSGKTSVLVERFVRAVREDGIAPGRILAITFTERAAAELRERVRARLLELGEREAARDTEGAPIGTFHGFCARLLRTHAIAARLDPDFTILDETGAARLRLLAFRRALAALLSEDRSPGPREEAIDLLAAYGPDRLRGMVLGVYAEQRSRGARLPTLPDPQRSLPVPDLPESPASAPAVPEPPASAPAVPEPPASAPAVPEPLASASKPPAAASEPLPPDSRDGVHEPSPAPPLDALRACALLGEILEQFGRGYAELKRARSALDFDDLELLARELLEHHDGVRSAWAERLELLMVDEFQDTNRRQLAVLEQLARDNLFTVGDELQSIYGFRHAEVGIFRERRRRLHSEGDAIALAHNFRSRPPIIAAVNSVFGERFGDAYTPLIAAREEGPEDTPPIELLLTDKSGWAQSPHARAVAGSLPPAALWRQAEARLLAQRVAELVADGQAAAGDVAVLLRAAGDLPVYERALEERGLRTLAAVGSFWGHQQVGDLLAWLRALANPLDELALYSVLASPLVGISSDGLALLALAARAEGVGAWGAIASASAEGELCSRLPASDRERLHRFAPHFVAERHAAPMHSLAELLLRAIAWSGYERHVLSLTWGERRLANVHKLLRLARRFEAAEGRDLRAFLDHVEHRGALSDSSEPHAPIGSEPDAVRLMTIHAAKGLEFPVVCLADLGRTGNGTPPDLLVDGDRIGLRLAHLDSSPPAASLRYEELWEERRRAEAAEEERIVYVAMTRARERLLLSGACDFERWPGAGGPPAPGSAPGGAPIAWLAPALAAELPALTRSLERPVAELTISGEEGVAIRCLLNSPATVGEVLRERSLRPPAVSLARPAAPNISPPGSAADPPQADPLGGLEGTPINYSALSELERCGYRYYLEQVLELPENNVAHRGSPHRHGLRARARGVLVHRLFQSFEFTHPGTPIGERPTPEEVAALARELGLVTAPSERDEIAGLVRSAVGTPLAERLAVAPQVHREHPFALTLPRGGSAVGGEPARGGSDTDSARGASGTHRARGGPDAGSPREGSGTGQSQDSQLVTGVIDLLALERSGEWLVVDYKSDHVGAQEDLRALVEREYRVQQLLYALAALHAGAPRVEIVHWFLERPREWVSVSFLAEQRTQLEQTLRARVQRARARGFAVSETPHRGLCLTCPGRARLCSWNEADTLRERPTPESPPDR